MNIAQASLNPLTVSILNQAISSYGGLGIGGGATANKLPTASVAQDKFAAGNRVLDTVAGGAASVDTSAARRALNNVNQSLSDLRDRLTASQTAAQSTDGAANAPSANATNTAAQNNSGQDNSAQQPDSGERDIYETQNVYATEDVYEDQNVYATQNVYQTQNVYSTRDVYETQDVYQTQNVYQTENTYGTRPVYTQEAVYATNVKGTQSLSGDSSVSAAGIDTGADLSIQVGNNNASVIKFTSSTSISVTTNGTTTQFKFNANDGSFKTGLLQALNSVSGLSASYSSDGKLQLTTANAQSLTIADVANGFLDFSKSPLAPLGLTAGTTQSSVVGYQQVQTGTEQYVTGTQQVVVGTQQVKTGTQQVKVGTEQYVSGTQQVQVGTEQVVVGTEQVKTGTEQVLVGTKQVKVGTEPVAASVGQTTTSVDSSPSSPSPLGSDAKAGIQSAVAVLARTINSSDFKAIDADLDQLPGGQQLRAALDQLQATDISQLANSSSSHSLDTILGTVNSALSATTQLSKSFAATGGPRPTVLLPTSLLGAAWTDTDTATLLATAVKSYTNADRLVDFTSQLT